MPFVKGDPNINRAGRPKGETMKEFARKFYLQKTEEEKIAYIEMVEKKRPGFAWEMGEGKAHQTQESKVEVTLPTPILPLDFKDNKKTDGV